MDLWAWSSFAGEAELERDEGTEVQEDWYSFAAVAEVIVFSSENS